MTNFEALKNMSLDELAWFLVYEDRYAPSDCFKFRGSTVEYQNCEGALEACKKWLKTELEEFPTSTKYADEDQFELSVSANGKTQISPLQKELRDVFADMLEEDIKIWMETHNHK